MEQEKQLELLDILKSVITGNQDLSDEKFKDMIERVGANYEKISGESKKVSMRERRKRMIDNYVGLQTQMMLQMHQMIVSLSEELDSAKTMINALCNARGIPFEARLSEREKLAQMERKYMEQVIKNSKIIAKTNK